MGIVKNVQPTLLCGMGDQRGLIRESKEQKEQEEKKNLIVNVKLAYAAVWFNVSLNQSNAT